MKLAILALLPLALNLPLFASTITVNSLGDTGAGSGTTGDLRYAISIANNGDNIAFVVSGTITLNSQLNIAANLTINGGSGITIDGNLGTIFDVTGATTDLFSNLTLENASNAITGASNASVAVANSTLSNNATAIANVNATVTNSTLTGNSVAAISGGTVTVANSTIVNNADGLVNTAMTVVNSTLSGNSDAAIDSGTGSILDSTFANNASGLLNTNATITNSTLAGNNAAINGGTVSLYDSTVSGGTYGSEGSDLTVGNTIIDGNTTDVDSGATVTDLGSNLIGSGAGFFFNGENSDIVGANPGLAPLGNYGGPTLTYALLPGSPAIEAGNIALIPSGITTDQRGFARIVDGTVDIGAYELIPEPATYVTCLLAFALGARRLRKPRK